MEKPTTSKTKNKLVKLLQKAVRNLPRRNKKLDDGVAAGVEKSSESTLPIIKTAADGGQMVKSSSFGEPSSPKISCIGQIKHRKKLAKNIHLFLHQEMCPAIASRNKGSLMKPSFFLPEAEKIPSNMRNNHVNNNDASKQMVGRKSSCVLSEKAPCLDHMKRFPSCHEGKLSDIDGQIAQIGADGYDMNENNCDYSDFEEEEEGEGEVMRHFSFPLIGVGGRGDHVQELEPRKEVNLWRRRPMEQLTPLKIMSPCTPLTNLRSRFR